MHGGEPRTYAIERRDGLTVTDFVEQYCRPRRPVVLTDAIRQWPAASRWTPAYFADRVGDRRVEIDGGTYTVTQVIDMLDRSTPEAPAPYLRAQKVADVFPDLVGDLSPPIAHAQPNWADSRLLLPSMRRGRLHEILIGGRGAGFHVLHYDKDHLHAFISQLHGDKDFYIYPPDQSRFLYPKPSVPNQSQVDIFAPDLDRHPDFVHAHQTTLTLHRGETVFMPPGWWHTTRMSEPSISVTWNVVNDTNWDDVVTDTRRRVVRRAGGPAGAAFDLYAKAAARVLRARNARPSTAA